MGWTHDYSDVSGKRRSATPLNSLRGSGSYQVEQASEEVMGIPLILRRRARWVSARLRHPRT
ncbi:hypothetical protein [Streptomyces odontomachi]|uniref:hypothetical protein n=1 Tax=Streptomyces odontomachi TaxID=2944940 RepID=UPI00210A0DE6